MCEYCEYEENTNGSLQKHMQSIHNAVKYSCKCCDYSAKQIDHLHQHMQSIYNPKSNQIFELNTRAQIKSNQFFDKKSWSQIKSN